jgi:hypothetical protein
MEISELFPAGIVEEFGHLDSYVTSKRRQSLPELLRAWSRYASRIATREPIELDDYVGMLFARDAIQDIMQQATPTASRLLGALTTLDDALFFFCTKHDKDNVLEAVVSIGPYWWWHRIPITQPPAPEPGGADDGR